MISSHDSADSIAGFRSRYSRKNKPKRNNELEQKIPFPRKYIAKGSPSDELKSDGGELALADEELDSEYSPLIEFQLQK